MQFVVIVVHKQAIWEVSGLSVVSLLLDYTVNSFNMDVDILFWFILTLFTNERVLKNFHSRTRHFEFLLGSTNDFCIVRFVEFFLFWGMVAENWDWTLILSSIWDRNI